MQTNEKKQFQLSPQVLFVVAVVLLALVVPIAMGIYAIGRVMGERPVPAQEISDVEIEAATDPLRQKLESVAEEQLGGAGWDASRLQIKISASNPEAEQGRIEARARKWGGTALPSELEDGTKKVLVVLDREKAEEFIRDELGQESEGDSSKIPPDQTRIWVEVLIIRVESP